MAQLCREQKFIQAYDELYAKENVSVDPRYSAMSPAKGRMTIIERIKQFLSNVTIHKIKVSNPLYAGNYFAINFWLDFSIKNNGRKHMEELCICHVKDGKITWQPNFMD